MTEITRVPLQPIAKGALSKVWIGVAAIALAAGGIAWSAIPHGVEVVEVVAGTGATPGETDVIFVRYVGKLSDGSIFDEGGDTPLPVEGIFPKGQPLPLANMIPGFREGAVQMKKGGKYVLEIPAEKGYGANPPEGAPIPPNADLTFEVELVDFMSQEEFEGRLASFRQMMQQVQGAPHGEMPAAPPQP